MKTRPTSYLFLLFLGLLSWQCSSLTSNFPSAAGGSSRGGMSTSHVRQNIANFAISQEGARYKYAGRNPRTGFDCSGFTYYVFDNFGINLTPISRAQEDEGRRIDVKDAQTGDLLFFRRSKGGNVFHVALVVENEPNNLTVIHSTSSRGVIKENLLNSSYWRNKVTTARDVLGR